MEPSVVIWSTGAPQGTVFSPFLFALYTSDFRYNTGSCHLQTFSDDATIVGCVSPRNGLQDGDFITSFVNWCELHHLRINFSKRKDMEIGFSRKLL